MSREHIAIVVSLSFVYVFFGLFLLYPQLGTVLALYTNGAMFLVVGMVKGFKGHNWGLCKCGKDHGKVPMLGRKSSDEAKRNMSKAQKGRKHSEETKEKIRVRAKGRILSSETRRKISEAKKGTISWFKGHNFGGQCKKCGKVHVNGMLGKTHTAEARKKISILATGRIFTRTQRQNMSKGLKAGHLKRTRKQVQEYYNIPDGVEFFPATLYEHQFARKVLIDKEHGSYLTKGFITRSGLCARPLNIRNNSREVDREQGIDN